jgi:hypothetical protein
MRPALHQYLKPLEDFYGKLGEAQKNELSKLLEGTSGFRHFPIEVQWTELNQELCAPGYATPEDKLNMKDLYAAGNEFPSIFKGDIDEIDMNDLL